MTGLAGLTLSLILVPVEAGLAWYAWTRVRPVHDGAGRVVAFSSGLAAGLVVLLVVLAVVGIGLFGGLAWAGRDVEEVGFALGIVVLGLGALLVPLGHAAAVSGAGLGLALLVGRIRGTALDDREAVDPGETLR